MKKTVSIVLTIILILSLAGCGSKSGVLGFTDVSPKDEKETEAAIKAEPEKQEEPEEPLDPKWAAGQPVPTASGFTSVLHGEFDADKTVVEQGEYEWDDRGYYQFHGLKNKDIQSSINKEIRDAYYELHEWKEDPPYRGIAIEKRKWEGLSESYRSGSMEWSCVGNVLSVQIMETKQYEDDGYYCYINDSRTLNFDLNTGKQVRLSDIVADDAGLEYINNAIREKIKNSNSMEEGFFFEDGYDYWRLAGEFTGVTDDQKYYLSETGDTVHLILDYDTPWAKLDGFSSWSMAIDIRDVSALDRRFVYGDSLFEEGRECLYLVPFDFDESKLDFLADSRLDFCGAPNVYLDADIYLYDELTAAQKKYMTDFYDESIVRAKNMVEGSEWNDSVDEGAYITIYSSPQRYGKYTSVYCNFAFDRYNWASEDEQNFTIYDNRYALYEDGKTDPISVEDLFVPGTDVWAVLEDAAVETALSVPDNLATEEQLRELFKRSRDFYKGIDISYNWIGLMYDYAAVEELAMEIVPQDPDSWRYAGTMQILHFELFDPEILTIYD